MTNLRARRQRINVHQSMELLYQDPVDLIYANSRLFDSYKSILQENMRLRQSAQRRSTPESNADSERDLKPRLRGQVMRRMSTPPSGCMLRQHNKIPDCLAELAGVLAGVIGLEKEAARSPDALRIRRETRGVATHVTASDAH
uniref:Uncharacterized protein n=1 Tax=Pyricularia oryzae (strain P131) TaxID=1143193 RepID=L7IPW0_PYRO1